MAIICAEYRIASIPHIGNFRLILEHQNVQPWWGSGDDATAYRPPEEKYAPRFTRELHQPAGDRGLRLQ
jgi:hypothetical protein